MEKLRDEKPDDLDITSIGALYRGQWDKKYWSSSRVRSLSFMTNQGFLFDLSIQVSCFVLICLWLKTLGLAFLN